MIITRTPLRISFFGGGTDLPSYYKKFGGEVISTTIDKYLYITCRRMIPFWDFKNRLVYGSKTELTSNLEQIEHPSIRETLKYMQVEYGIDLHYNTDIPSKSGIGSSSSFTVGLLNTLQALDGNRISKKELAMQAIYIEQELIRESVGSQDQIAAAYGGFNHIIFNKNGHIEVKPINISKNKLRELNKKLLLVFTGFQRFAMDIERAKIQSMESHYDNLEKIKFYVSQAKEILEDERDICEFGDLLNETWKQKKNLSDCVSNAKIDFLYELAMNNGAKGGKLLGAGGGGFMLFFVDIEKQEHLIKVLNRNKYICIPFNFENTGSQIIYES